MQERKSKLADFTAAVTGAASAKAAEMNAETERLEREALDEYASALRSAAEKRRASALADAKVRENKRIVAEGWPPSAACSSSARTAADDVFNEVRARILELPKKPEYADTLKNQLWRALDAVPGAREARVWLRREDMGFAHGLNSASPGVRARVPRGQLRSRRAHTRVPGEKQKDRPLLRRRARRPRGAVLGADRLQSGGRRWRIRPNTTSTG